MMRGFRSIRTRIFVGALALFMITTGAVSWMAAASTRDAMEVEIERAHAAQAGAFTTLLGKAAQSMLDSAEEVGRDPRVVDGVREGNATAAASALQHRLDTINAFELAYLFNAVGDFVVAAEAPEHESNLSADAEAAVILQERYASFFDTVLLTHSPVLVQGVEPGTWSVIAPVHPVDPEHDPIGVILFSGPPLAAITDATLQGGEVLVGPTANADQMGDAGSEDTAEGGRLGAALRSLYPGGTDATAARERFYVIDRNGIVQAGTGGIPVGTAIGEPFPAFLAQPGSTVQTPLADEEVIATAFPVDHTPWMLVYTTPTAAAFAPVDRLLTQIGAVAGIALILVVLMSEIASRRLLDPLKRVQTAARKVTEGTYGEQVRVNTRDEFADLAGAFNNMSARLQQERLALEAHQRHLEALVQGRTAELTDKNAELESFVYAVSHDLKTPLVTLEWLADDLREALERDRAALEAVREDARKADADADAGTTPQETATLPGATQGGAEADGAPADDDVMELVERMERNIRNMQRLVEDLLELARVGSGEHQAETVPMRETIDEVLLEIQAEIQSRRAHVEIAQIPDAIVMERAHIKQVLRNLIGNAIKYGRPENGEATVRLRPGGPPRADGSPPELRRPEEEPTWCLEVHDDGPGVPDEFKERIFQLFVRGPDRLGRELSGTGVGLPIVRKIARHYDGEASVGDSPHGGALFWMTIPSRLVRSKALERPLRAATRDASSHGLADADGTPSTHDTQDGHDAFDNDDADTRLVQDRRKAQTEWVGTVQRTVEDKR